MKTLLTFCILLLITNIDAQTYFYEQIQDSAYSCLKQNVGEQNSEFFEFYPEMVVTYKNWFGREKLKWIEPEQNFSSKRIIDISVCFFLKHPGIETYKIGKGLKIVHPFRITFDNNIKQTDTFDYERVPRFIIENRKFDWLSNEELTQIINGLEFEKKTKKLNINIVFIETKGKYYFVAESLFGYDKRFDLYECFLIDVVTGEIVLHSIKKSIHPCTVL